MNVIENVMSFEMLYFDTIHLVRSVLSSLYFIITSISKGNAYSLCMLLTMFPRTGTYIREGKVRYVHMYIEDHNA